MNVHAGGGEGDGEVYNRQTAAVKLGTCGIKMHLNKKNLNFCACADDIEQRQWFHRSATLSKKQTNLAEKTCTQCSSFQTVVSETEKTGGWGVSAIGLRVGVD